MRARRVIGAIRWDPTRPSAIDYHVPRGDDLLSALATRRGEARVSAGQFAASLVMGFLSILLPLLVFIAMVATCVYIARQWIDRRR